MAIEMVNKSRLIATNIVWKQLINKGEELECF